MLELAEHAEMLDKSAGLDCPRDEDVPATKEALTFLFKQIWTCISDFASQTPLFEVPDVDENNADKDVLINQYKMIIRQLKDTNKEIINKHCKQATALKEQFENLKAYFELREISRQKLEFTAVQLKTEIVKVKQQVAEYEQKTEIKSLHHSEDVHALQQLVQRLVSSEGRENVLSMSQGGSLFQNPNAPPPILRDSGHMRENGLSASLHSLFDNNNNNNKSRLSLKHSMGMDTDVTIGDNNYKEMSSSGSLRNLHTFTRDDPVIVNNEKNNGDRYSNRDPFGRHKSNDIFRITDGINHIQDSEEGDRKRQKTEDQSRMLASKMVQQPLRSTHPLDVPFASQSHQYHQYQPPQHNRGAPSNNNNNNSNSNNNNSIRKLSPPANSPLLQAKTEKIEQPPTTPSGQKKQPSEIWASEVLLAFSQGADSPTEPTATDVKRRMSSDDIPPPSTSSSLRSSNGGPTNPNNLGSNAAERIERNSVGMSVDGQHVNNNNMDTQATIRRLSDELSMRRSSGALDEYAFRSSGGLPGLGPVLGGSGSKKRRGKLPETATSLLKRWLLEHQQHPYPTEEEKAGLATTTSLTLNQINNWFTNARRRILPKQKHPGSPPSSPPLSSSSSSSIHPPHHHGGHDEGHDSYEANNSHSSHNFDSPRHSSTSPTFNHSSSNNHHNNTHSTFTPSSLPLSLSHLSHNTTLSNPLMAQLTAQLAHRISNSPRPSPTSTAASSTSSPSSTPSPSSASIPPSPSHKKTQAPTDTTSPMETDETPTTAPHTISLTTQKKENNELLERISTESLSKPQHSQPKPQLPLSSNPPVSPTSFPPKDATSNLTVTPTPATPVSTPSIPPPSAPAPPPVSRPPIFPSHPLFASSPPSALTTLAQLGVSLPSQPLESPQP